MAQRHTYPFGGHTLAVLSVAISCSFHTLHHVEIKKAQKCGKQLGGDNREGGSRAEGLNTSAFYKGDAVRSGRCSPHGGSRESSCSMQMREGQDCIHC